MLVLTIDPINVFFVISSAWNVITPASLDGLICILFMVFFFFHHCKHDVKDANIRSIVQSFSQNRDKIANDAFRTEPTNLNVIGFP